MVPGTLQRIAVISLVALSLLLSATSLFSLMKSSSAGPDNVSKWESRIQIIKQKLPANIETIGYLADEDLRNASSTNDARVEFFLTQYSLSPLMVRHGSKYPWIIGNFSANFPEDQLKKTIGAYEIEDMGFGIYLIHRVKK